ncbi:unnamed protein product [Schistosoma curassoni]|nr:unnamed protein product [Schistosoma curassoni]
MNMSSGTFHLSPCAPITKFFKDKSVKEVRENTSHINAHLISFKRWLRSMPHLSCADDDRIFLPFLRQAKYNHSEAQMRLDNFITLRTSPESPVVNWYDRSTITNTILDEYLNMGFHCPIGFLHDGTFLFLIRIGCWNNNRVSTESVLKLLMIQLDRILEDPRVQICGLRVFIDFTGVSPSLLDTINPKKTIKDLSKVLQVGECIMKGSISVLIAISRLQPVFELKMLTVDKAILCDFDESVIVQYFQTVSLLRRKMKYDWSL